MDCKLVRGHLDAYVDGELEPTPVIEFERHLDDCTACRNELALSRLIQRGVRETAQPAAPRTLTLRLSRALDEVSISEGRGTFQPRSPWAVLLTGAASLVLLGGSLIRSDSSHGNQTEAGIATDVLGEIVQRHVDQLPTDITADAPDKVSSWLRGKVDFRMSPVEFNEPQVHFLGARVSHVGAHNAAKLYYSVGSSRLTTVVFQPPQSFQHALHDDLLWQRMGAHRERLGSHVVTYHNVHGYTVPVFEHDGVVYAFTGDLDQRRLLKLVASARLP
jgi:anti-sigma factor RsiW